MKTSRLIAICSVAAAAACASSVERGFAPETATVSAHESIGAMHAAIPANRANGDVFEYSTVVAATSDAVVFKDQGGQVFEYN